MLTRTPGNRVSSRYLRPVVLSTLYVLVAGTWVVGTSLAAGGVTGPSVIEIVKGAGFVLASGLILYLSLRAQAESMRAGEERYRELAENVADLIYRYRVAPEPGFEYVSPSSTAMIGYTPDEHYADPQLGLRVVHPDDRPALEAMLARPLTDDPVRLRWIHKDGRVVWIEQRNRQIRDAAGAVVAILGVARDVTAAVQAEHRLAFQAALLGQIDDALIATDAGGRVSHWNAGAERMTGIAAAEAIGVRPEDLFVFQVLDPDGVAGVRSRTAPGQAVRGEVIAVTRAGARVHLDFSTVGAADETGAPGRLTIARDVTAQRRESAMLRAMFDSSPFGIAVIDDDGTIRYWSPALAAITGYPEAEVLGRRPDGDLPLGPVLGADREVVEGSITVRSGEAVPVRALAAPLLDSEATMGRVLFVEDLREHERLELQLRQAQKMEAVGRLAGGVAHDFNNLLTVIQGYGQILATRLDGDEAADLGQLLYAADRAAQMTRHLLAFSRGMPVELGPVAVDTVLGEALPMVRRLVPERIDFVADLDAGLEVVSNAVEIEQILLNLVVNAVDATPERGRIVVETRREWLSADFVDRHLGARTGAHLRLSVSDTGTGMDATTRARIFEPFFTTKGTGEGTGLGLATVYSIVERAGGTIWVYSELGSGTTFRIYLPVASSGPAGTTVQAAQAADGLERVLLVEDEPQVRDLAARALRAFGYEVIVAPRSCDAVALAAKHDVHVLVTDVVMPGRLGPELADEIDLPVVFMSGYPGASLPALRLDAPGRRFVEKPFQASTLAAAVRSAVDERRRFTDAP